MTKVHTFETTGEGFTVAACLEGRAASEGVHHAKVIAEQHGFEIRA
jgi:hypothetical protein